MTVSISNSHNEARLTGTRDHLDAGSGSASIEIYDGVRPAAGGPGTNLLVSIPLTDPCGTVTANVLTLTAAAIPLVLRTGTATWARVRNGTGLWAMDADVSNTTGVGDIKLDRTDLLAGGSVQLVSALIG